MAELSEIFAICEQADIPQMGDGLNPGPDYNSCAPERSLRCIVRSPTPGNTPTAGFDSGAAMNQTRNPRRARYVAFALTAGLLLSLAQRGYGESALSEKPPESSQPYQGSTADSWVFIKAEMPLADLSAVVNSAAPTTFSGNGNGHGCKNFTLFRIWHKGTGGAWCGDVHYDYTVTRGTIAISPAPNRTDAVLAQLTVSLDGHLTARGDLGKHAVKDKHIVATTALRLTGSMKLDDKGCPAVDIETDYNWTSHPRLELAGGVWVDVDDAGNKGIKQVFDDAREKVQQALSCDKFQKMVAEHWKAYTFTLQIAPQQPKMTVVMVPTLLGVDGTHVIGNNVTLAAYAKAQTLATTSPEASYPASAPNVVPLASVPDVPTIAVQAPLLHDVKLPTSSLSVVLPVFLGYPELAAALKNYAVGKTFGLAIAGHDVDVAVLDGEIYPSGESLAVGLKIKTKFPGRLFNTTGWVYLTGRPVVSADGNALTLENVTFSRQLDNDFWTAGTFVFQDLIRSKVQEAIASSINLPQRKDQALKTLVNTVSSKGKGNGYSIELYNPQIRLNRVVVADSLVVEPQVDSALVINTDLKEIYASMQAKPK